ncbi:Uncharacterised protein [Vibrio cholerae]|nr:Uncharacterised protein [Vibrio cholerae]
MSLPNLSNLAITNVSPFSSLFSTRFLNAGLSIAQTPPLTPSSTIKRLSLTL